jgi:hypothetical protein
MCWPCLDSQQPSSCRTRAAANVFCRNLISAKELFWFGTDAIEPKTLAAYQKSEKNTATAHSNIAWASQTGNGLLFIGDKKAPTGVINLVSYYKTDCLGSASNQLALVRCH